MTDSNVIDLCNKVLAQSKQLRGMEKALLRERRLTKQLKAEQMKDRCKILHLSNSSLFSLQDKYAEAIEKIQRLENTRDRLLIKHEEIRELIGNDDVVQGVRDLVNGIKPLRVVNEIEFELINAAKHWAEARRYKGSVLQAEADITLLQTIEWVVAATTEDMDSE